MAQRTLHATLPRIARPFLLASAALALAHASAPRAQTAIWRIDCGGPGGPAPYGPDFSADQAYSPATQAGYEGGWPTVQITPEMIGGHPNSYALLLSAARSGWQAYRFDLPAGTYVLRLHFAEIELHGPGLRRFDVALEGQPWLTQFDVAAQAGIRHGLALARLVEVSDGRLDLRVLPGSDPALLNAVEVWSAPASFSGPAVPAGLVLKPGFGENLLAWTAPDDALLGGWQVERAGDAAGPWMLVASLPAAPPRFHDAGLAVGQPAWYRVRAVDVAGNLGIAAQAGPAIPLSSAASALRVYTLSIAPEDLKKLNQMVLTEPDTQVPCTFGYQGEKWTAQASYRGAGSLLMSKKSFNVRFPADALFEGRREINLKAQFIDPGVIRESLSGDLFHEAGHPVSIERWTHLEVNGESWGVYQEFEEVDGHYLSARNRDLGGSIYKCEADMGLLGSAAEYAQAYVKKTNKGSGNSDLVAFVELVNNPHTSPAVLAAQFDVSDFLDYAAVVGWSADTDQVQHNCYLLHDHALERWEWITWDNNRCLFLPDHPVDFGTSSCATCIGLNALREAVLSVPAFRWRYCEKIRSLMAGSAAPASFAALAAARHLEIAADAHADADKQGWESDELFDAGPGLLQSFAQQRAAFVNAYLATYQPAQPPTALWINEFLASNQGGLVDEQGEHEDWIEIYNASSAPVEASGLYLTNELSDPTRWALPAGSWIAPGGYLLLWCDAEPQDGPHHTSFTLDVQGGELGLFDGNLELLDFYHYCPQLPDVAAGRRHDGGALFALLPAPTPGSANITTGNLPPLISWVDHQPALAGSAQPVTVSCQIVDLDQPLQASLYWRASAGPFQTTALQPMGAERYQAVIPAQSAGKQVEFYFVAVDSLGQSSLLPLEAPAELYGYTVTDPSASALRIAEILADNGATLADGQGEYDDWVELYNAGEYALDLSGLYLSDNLANPTKWKISAGTGLGPQQSLLVWADEDGQDGPLHANFKLSKSGESIGLFDSDANGNAFLDGFTFGSQTTDVSLGRLPDAESGLYSLLDPSPGEPNLPAPGGVRRYDALAPGATQVSLSADAALLGLAMQLDIVQMGAQSPGLVGLGSAPVALDLGTLGVLLTLPLPGVALALQADAAGTAILQLAVPADTSLYGASVYLQAWSLANGLANALVATIGTP